MKVFNFLTTGNEQRLMSVIFPPDYDISQLKLEDIKQFPKFNVTAAKFCRLALSYSDTVVIEPATFKRKLDKKDHGKDDSPNWPTSDCRYSLRLIDTESNTLEKLSDKYTISKTETMVWCIRNFNAQLYSNPGLLSNMRSREERMTTGDSKLFTLRLRNEQIDFYRGIADRDKISLGRVIREVIVKDYELSISSLKENKTTQTMSPGYPAQVDAYFEGDSDEFDFDMEEEI